MPIFLIIQKLELGIILLKKDENKDSIFFRTGDHTFEFLQKANGANVDGAEFRRF